MRVVRIGRIGRERPNRAAGRLVAPAPRVRQAVLHASRRPARLAVISGLMPARGVLWRQLCAFDGRVACASHPVRTVPGGSTRLLPALGTDTIGDALMLRAFGSDRLRGRL
jgi:hypothetical protein